VDVENEQKRQVHKQPAVGKSKMTKVFAGEFIVTDRV
jgi:hypothetical protein